MCGGRGPSTAKRQPGSTSTHFHLSSLGGQVEDKQNSRPGIHPPAYSKDPTWEFSTPNWDPCLTCTANHSKLLFLSSLLTTDSDFPPYNNLSLASPSLPPNHSMKCQKASKHLLSNCLEITNSASDGETHSGAREQFQCQELGEGPGVSPSHV